MVRDGVISVGLWLSLIGGSAPPIGFSQDLDGRSVTKPRDDKTQATVVEAKQKSADPLAWTNSLAEGLVQAQKARRPIFAVVSGKSCPYCRQLEKEIAKAEVQSELARWTLVSVDADAAPADARTLAVGPIPALRVLTLSGKTIASHDGALSADELVTWLSEQFDSASGGLDLNLIAGDSLTALGAIKLVKEFRRRDPAVREAAIRQLLPHPQMAAGPVSTGFAEGALSTRLAAMELLAAWKAPIEGLDPWRPETMTEERLKVIVEWAATIDANAAAALAKTKEISVEDRNAAHDSISRMLKATPPDASAIREQLARFGVPLLPLVYDSLKTVETDEARERLTALRYRLTATDRLAIEWSGGIERLAAANSATRRQAMDELASRAGPEEETLLLELFSDPEPLLRELALGALYRINGENADSALIRLLEDPEPNVRAAVLKQLAESSQPSVVPKIVKYVEKEQDPDLIVQAIRVLRESPLQSSINCLTSLLGHESWRIRAEAAEALGKITENRSGGDTEGRAEMYLALVERLKDEDAFVVSRAVAVLGKADLVTVVDPLAEVASRHPELAVSVVTALAGNRANAARVEKHLREFSQNADPQVRAAAISGLCQLGVEDLESEITKALEDPDTAVRIAAAESIFTLLNADSSTESFFDPEPLTKKLSTDKQIAEKLESDKTPAQKEENTESNELVDPAAAMAENEAISNDIASETDPEEMVGRLRKKFPKWLPKVDSQLRKLLAAPTDEEQLPAALSLVAVGSFDDAMPVLSRIIQESPTQGAKIAEALFWLPWEKRRVLFEELLLKSNSGDQLAAIAIGFAKRRDMRAAKPLWETLAAKETAAKHPQPILDSLKHLYLGSNWYSPDQSSRAERDRLESDAIEQAKNGSRWQRLTAYALLLLLGKESSVEIAREMKGKEGATHEDQLDALRVLLVASDLAEATSEAKSALSSDRSDFRALSLAYFAFGPAEVSSIKEGSFDLKSPYSSNGTTAPSIPDDLSPEFLVPFVSGGNPVEAAQAGYLLCLMERPDGLAPLVDFWRVNQRNDARWRKLVYTAAAALGEDQLPLLQEIYAGMGAKRGTDYSDVSDFYWTIRSLKGPEALTLRKKIRDDVGMENLQR